MITAQNGLFHLQTAHTSYLFRATKFGHLEHIHYGPAVDNSDAHALAPKRTAQSGSTVAYDPSDNLYAPDTMCLEWSGIGRGDYRYAPAELILPGGGFVCDFRLESFRIFPGCAPSDSLPAACGDDAQTLELTLRDAPSGAALQLCYTVFANCDVITRRAVLKNTNPEPLVIRRLLSLSLDMPDCGYSLITFDGDWIKEAHRTDKPLAEGLYVNGSTTGASSNKHNPGFLLAESGASEEHGNVYGFNLVYSGNHLGFAERTSHGLVRIGLGINPHCFQWTLAQGERFETPEAVMTFSADGFNGMSAQFHNFVNRHIVRGQWQRKPRPVLYNSWEACFFKFNASKLLRLARTAKNLGAELFVLDDGWFKGRDDDTAGLGDYAPNPRKFPHGLSAFADEIRMLGMGFGIWVEPEMVNENSDLYRAHPDWALRAPGHAPTLGRNQLVLDLCNPAVRDYIVEHVGKVLDDTAAAYVKWDMNRHISDFHSPHVPHQGEFFHRYILGLYDILSRIFAPRPHILLETCSSGGNRFDLGMLCHSPQIWASDNTDPAARLHIQGGLSYLYPLSTMGAHVSDAPHQQTLRATPLSTRFNVAAFGSLGYELDVRYLSAVERQEIKEQIAFYKKHRKTLQFGRFSRIPQHKANKIGWQCASPDGNTIISGLFQTLAGVSEGPDRLRVVGLDPNAHYRVSAKPQRLYLHRFGGLVKHILPVSLNPDGTVLRTANRLHALQDCAEEYDATGAALTSGIYLNNQFMGSHYNAQTRLLGDFGSNIYVSERVETA